MDQEALEQRLRDLPLGPVRYLTSTGSTNQDAARWADAGAPHLALIVADKQTQGRGRLQRRWYTLPGTALAFSVILVDLDFLSAPAQPDLNLGRLTALGALAVSQALNQGYGLQPQIKWPNDVLLARKKVAGVLAEAQWQGENLNAVILGIGLNVSTAAVPPRQEFIYPPTSLEDQLGKPVDRLDVLHAVLSALLDWLPRLSSGEFLQAWEAHLAFRHEWVRLYDPRAAAGQPLVEGRLLGLDAEGHLQLRDRDGQILSFDQGELRLRPFGAGDPK